MAPSYGRETHKARRVFLHLSDRIRSGLLPVGAKLPSEAALCAEFGVARTTVRQALDGLVQEGLVEKRMGLGSYVRASGRSHGHVQGDIADAIQDLRRMGRETAARVIRFGYLPPTAEVAAALGLEPGQRVQHAVRVRSLDGRPFSYLVSQVPEALGLTFTPEDLAATPLLDLLERAGARPQSASQEIGAVLASPEMAAALETELGSPLIALTRVMQGADGRGIEYLEAYYRPDRYRLRLDLVRTPGRAAWKPE